MFNQIAAEFVFALTLLATFVAALLARRHSGRDRGDDLAGRNLNRWLIGLSAGTTANSGFIVTAAVGLGYAYGLQWVLLPIAWLLGDLIFWYFFPSRINALGHESRATTLSELLRDKLSGPFASALSVLSAIVIMVCLAGYTSAQWLAGQKFLTGAFGLSDMAALTIFAVLIVSYSSIGGFRGSIYTDTLQAGIRIVGTTVAIVAVAWFATTDPISFSRNIAGAGDGFLRLFPGGTIITSCGFVFGFAAAAIGFGLGQPQIVSRYLAGSNPEETRSAWWIYMGFVQFTWITMTVFGMILRGVMPAIADPETGLSLFFHENIGAIATGIIAADVFATIASTSNGLLVAMAQAFNHDLLPRISKVCEGKIPIAATTLLIGLITMGLSMVIHGSVVSVALSSVSMMGAGLAGPVMIKVMRWSHTAASLFMGMSAGLVTAISWKYLGWSSIVNEAGIGMASGLIVNYILVARSPIISSAVKAGSSNSSMH